MQPFQSLPTKRIKKLSVTCIAGLFFYYTGIVAADEEAAKIYQQNLTELILAEIALERHQLNQARDYFNSLAKKTQDPEIAHRSVNLALAMGAPETATQSAMIWARTTPKDSDAQQIAANLLINDNKAQQALPFFEKLLLIPNNIAELNRFTSALQVSNARGQQEFIKMLPSFEQKYADNPDILLDLALIYQQMKEPSLAFKTVDKVIGLKSDYTEALILRAQLLIDAQQQTQAIQYLQEQIQKYPNLSKLQLMYAEILVQKGDLAQAQTLLEKLKDDPITRGPSLLNLSHIAIKQEQLTQAKEYLLAASQEPKTQAVAFFLLGEISIFQNDPDTAVKWFSKIHDGSYYLNAQLQIANIYADSGDVTKARQSLHRIDVNNYEDAKQIFLTEADILLDAKQPEEAFDVIEKANNIIPDDVQLIYARGLISGQLGHFDSLEHDMKRVLQLDPNQTNALNILGALLTNNKERYPEALNYLNRAVALAPHDPLVLNNMGWLQFHLGNNQKALDYLNQSYKMQPNNETALHLSTVLWKNGDKTAAKKIVQDALQKAPNNTQLLELMNKFKEQP
jgi:tetratricopeptide (TPR) repeat protein